MKVNLQFSMNKNFYNKDPEGSELGKKIISHSISWINENGFEKFTFKKLAKDIGTTEASIYRYFGNKHKLLTYLTAWYWTWLHFQITFHTNNLTNPVEKLKKIISLMALKEAVSNHAEHINEDMLHHIIVTEGVKAYLTHDVSIHNNEDLFKPYKDLCAAISQVISEANSNYKYPTTLASAMIEILYVEVFFIKHLPSLTDFEKSSDSDKDNGIVCFVEDLVFSSLQISHK